MSRVIRIFHRGERGQAVMEVQSSYGEPGKGLQGDRQFGQPKSGSGRDLTLIELEAVEAVPRECDLQLTAQECRRNIVTQGVALNHLVGKTFRVGKMVCQGVRLCEPCDHLEAQTREGIKQSLIHRGGLRADIITAGEFKVGDVISIEL